MDTLKNLLQNNILTAVDDYFRHTYSSEVRDDISDSFVNRLADDAANSKRELRELFRQSNGWNENLQAIVINGTKTHNPDHIRIHNLANTILAPAKWNADFSKIDLIDRAISFFSRPNNPPDSYIDAINELAPNAYAPRKKRSRIFKAICDSLDVTDYSAGSDFQKLFAQFADELSTRKIDFKLFVSINPAHFITMSNPKNDERGSTLTSCHSFNVIDGEYNCGCTGYARDKFSFIVFTASDPDNPETLNNRKTSRQIFAYKPYNGLLLQSRLYNTNGGTYGLCISCDDCDNDENDFCEECEESCVTIRKGCGFGGYADWVHSDFNAKISIRNDHTHDFQTFDVGTYGLCISCGDLTSQGLYCDDCDNDENDFCEECEESCRETFDVINHYGERIHVCGHCLNRHYRYCTHCEEYRPIDDFTDGRCNHCSALEEVSA